MSALEAYALRHIREAVADVAAERDGARAEVERLKSVVNKLLLEEAELSASRDALRAEVKRLEHQLVVLLEEIAARRHREERLTRERDEAVAKVERLSREHVELIDSLREEVLFTFHAQGLNIGDDAYIGKLEGDLLIAKASADGAGSMMLDMQQECIAHVKRIAELEVQLIAHCKDHVCQECGEMCAVSYDLEPTPECNSCAHAILERVRRLALGEVAK
jgi:DNA repair exonuclease SbcCD ATPase subunit